MTCQPGHLFLFRWCGKHVFIRILLDGAGLPPCPVRWDECWEIPVLPSGQQPAAGDEMRRHVPVAAWLADLF
jgi:hypothetical protein